MSRRATYTISELAEAAGATARTVRFYTAEGLLPPPDARGRYALYSNEHLDRLRLIDRLKDAHQPLNAIRLRLERLTPEDIASLLDEAPGKRGRESLDDLLIKSAEAIRARSAKLREHPVRQSSFPEIANGQVRDSEIALLEDTREMTSYYERETDTWQRIQLAQGVELNVRLPLSEECREAIEGLKREAVRLFKFNP
jgi:DNA-binding transcriptional MerR regulator